MENASKLGPASKPHGQKNPLRIVAVVVALIVALGGASVYLQVTRPWQVDASPSVTSSNTLEAQAEDTQEHFLARERQQLQRAELRKILQRAELIREKIDALESEVGAYQAQFEEIRTSDLGRRLIENESAVRYFSGRSGEPLPHENVANYCRFRLDELTQLLREVVSESEIPFKVSPETRNGIERIRFEVAEATQAYVRHRQLLEAFVKDASEKSGKDSEARGSLNATGEHDVPGVDDEPGR